MRPFEGFNKIARLNREIVITEKIDGTNAQIFIAPAEANDSGYITSWFDQELQNTLVMYAGSRNRWVTPDNDNMGFAKWVSENTESLKNLGPGSHFGEWWGAGIQRNYGLKEKKFSLFNVGRWNETNVPACCNVVPTLYVGLFSETAIKNSLLFLREQGSVASAGFMSPEGIVIYHTAAKELFKVTLENDETPKTIKEKK